MAVTTATDKGLAGSVLSGRGPRPRPPAAGPGRQKHGSGRPEPAGGARALGVWVKPGLRFIPAWGRGAQTDALVSGLSRSTKATGLLAGRARGGGRRGFSPALREDGFLTRCRLYSQQINNFLSRQQCRPVCVCVCVPVSPAALQDVLPISCCARRVCSGLPPSSPSAGLPPAVRNRQARPSCHGRLGSILESEARL